MSVLSFIGKVSSGFGVSAGGIMLALIEFPTDTNAAGVDAAIVERLGWLYAPSITLFCGLAVVALLLYRLDRSTHEHNLKTLGHVAEELALEESRDDRTQLR